MIKKIIIDVNYSDYQRYPMNIQFKKIFLEITQFVFQKYKSIFFLYIYTIKEDAVFRNSFSCQTTAHIIQARFIVVILLFILYYIYTGL